MAESSKPLLTLAVCSYNQERFVKEAVEAAFAQTYSPLEIILTDDCSKDRTFEIMQQMAAAYRGPHKVVLNRNPSNFGLGKHLNRLIELVHGEFLVVAAADDVSLPTRVEVMHDAWERSNRKAHAIQCGTIDIDDEGNLLGGKDAEASTMPLEITEKRPVLDDYVRTLKPGIFGCALGYDPEMFATFGKVPDALIHEDNVIALRAFLLGPMHFVNLPLLKRRIHGNNIFSRVHERATTDEAVARQEARFVRDARNRMVLYEAFQADLRVAREKGLINQDQYLDLEKDCARIHRLFACQSEYPAASLARKMAILFTAWRSRADSYFIKWMIPRLLPGRTFQWTKVRLNSLRTSFAGRLAPDAQKRWT